MARWTRRWRRAYGWPEGIAEEDALSRLLALNAKDGAVAGGSV